MSASTVASATVAARSEPELLRLVVAGSVDDGKSTLIGRLLLDARAVTSDQIASVGRESRGDTELDLSLFTDGLRAEREQGITIDVAWRFFATSSRRFVIADAPGHVGYTPNMVTGASTADMAVVLVDARHGLTSQSRRHALVATLFGVPHLVVAVNKMDLVGYREQAFAATVDAFRAFAVRLGVRELTFIPVSALHGDNVVRRSTAMAWYKGRSLLEHLEQVRPASTRNLTALRLPVQCVIRSPGVQEYRAYAGQMAGGRLRPGDAVIALPSGQRTRVVRIDSLDGPLREAFPPLAVSVVLEDALDVGRGEMLCGLNDRPMTTRAIAATVFWMDDRPLAPGRRLLLKQTTRPVQAALTGVSHRVDLDGRFHPAASPQLEGNEIGRVTLRTAGWMCADDYRTNRVTGGLILIDAEDNRTVGAGTIQSIDGASEAFC